MKIVSFIYEYSVIKKILVHLGLYQVQEEKRAPPVPPAQNVQRELLNPMMTAGLSTRRLSSTCRHEKHLLLVTVVKN
jgi:hypothetical protein